MGKNFGEDRTCSTEDMIVDRQTHTDRHSHYNTPLPYRGRSNQGGGRCPVARENAARWRGRRETVSGVIEGLDTALRLG